jgi:hypothetical protein
MKRYLAFSGACVAALIAAVVVARAAETLRIVPVVHEGQVLVSVEVNDVDAAEVREVISSGLRTTFTYDIELRMVVPAWVDRTIATSTVAISDQYDNLTRQHRLSKAIDGRIAETFVTDDDAEAHKWLTMLKSVPLCETAKLDPNRDYYVRISTSERPRGASIFGWGPAVTGQAKFTFIP